MNRSIPIWDELALAIKESQLCSVKSVVDPAVVQVGPIATWPQGYAAKTGTQSRMTRPAKGCKTIPQLPLS